jgi:hypothetical protein
MCKGNTVPVHKPHAMYEKHIGDIEVNINILKNVHS